MRRRILTAILAITALSILLFGVPLAIVVERFVDQDATLRLERQAILAARDVPADYATNDDPVELPTGDGGTTIALYDMSGNRVAGDGPATADQVTASALANRVSDHEAGEFRVVAVPVTADEHVVGAIRAEQSTAASDARTWRIIGLIGGLAVTVFAVGAAVAVVVARRLARPVGHLTGATVALGHGDFEVDVPSSGVGEIDAAGAALAATARRLDTLIERERAFSSDASHQLRTPLAGLRAAIETELAFPRADHTEVLTESLADIDRLERTITELLAMARAQRSSMDGFEPGPVLAEVRDAWHGRLAAGGRPLRIDVQGDLPMVVGDAVLLRHALDVVIDNALVHGEGAVTIAAAATRTTVTVSVTDEGAGFSASAPPPTPEPHGMGLALAERLLGRMSARLVIARRDSRPRVDLVLTRVGPGPSPEPTRST